MKKQTQCQNRQNSVKSVIVKTYGDFGVIRRFWAAKTNPISVSPQHCWGLKKQSQFAAVTIGVTPYLKGDYENKLVCLIGENKPNSKPISRFRKCKRMLKTCTNQTKSHASTGIQCWSFPSHLTLQPMGFVRGTDTDIPARCSSSALSRSLTVILLASRGLSTPRPV